MNTQSFVPRHVLPVLVLAQFAGTSLWFAVNAVMPDLQRAFGWPATAVGTLTSALQAGFIAGTLVFALLAIADRFPPRRVFLVCALAGAGCTVGAWAMVSDFGALLANWSAMAGTYTVAELFDRIAADLNYKAYINDDSEEGTDRWENVQELRRLAMEFSTRSLDEFLENVALVADQDTISDLNAPTLLTFHAAKGLEFGAVFLVGLDDGILPHSRSFDEPEEMEEERRLAYVGITRAEKELFLTNAQMRTLYGQTSINSPSRFIQEIPEELLVEVESPNKKTRKIGSSHQPTRKRRSNRFAKAGTGASDIGWKVGDKANHKKWGVGTVVSVKGEGDAMELDIAFPSPIGVKRLLAHFAPIEKN